MVYYIYIIRYLTVIVIEYIVSMDGPTGHYTIYTLGIDQWGFTL
jgi:hypothetical protein